MESCLCCCLFFALVTLTAFADESYTGGIAKFQCLGRPCNGTETSFLFTRSNPDKPEILCNGTSAGTNFRPNKKTKVILAGNLGYVCLIAYPRELAIQLLYAEDCNVILYDWMDALGIEQLTFTCRVREVNRLGEKLASLLENIIVQTGANPSDFHLIGHSLGAHISGHTGQVLKQKGLEIDRITGIDPGAPEFEGTDPERILDKTDATWVDIIHIPFKKGLPNLGKPDATGHADFYIDTEQVLNSCPREAIISFLKLDVFGGLARTNSTLCAHVIVVEIFKASINPCGCEFIGVECKSLEDYKSESRRSCGSDGRNCSIMGLNWEKNERSREPKKYCVDVYDRCPYCIKDPPGVDTTGFQKTASDGSTSRCFDSGKSFI